MPMLLDFTKLAKCLFLLMTLFSARADRAQPAALLIDGAEAVFECIAFGLGLKPNPCRLFL